MAGLGDNELKDGTTASQQLPAALDVATNRLLKRTRSGRLRIPSLEEFAIREEPKWTIYSGSQNLAAALNDPLNREYDLFTRTWGMYFTPSATIPPTSIPEIGLTDFLKYLKETAHGRKVHRSIVRQLQVQSMETSSPVSPTFIVPIVPVLKQDGHTYDLNTIPRVFMQSDFTLGDPPTFQEVIPISQLFPGGGGKKGRLTLVNTQQSAKLLHEKLTHYLDIIEVHLAHHISQRSDMFFSTLSSQQELQTHIMQVRHAVVELRHKLRQVDSLLTSKGARLVHLCARRLHYNAAFQKLKLISTVQQTQPTIQLLLSTADFVAALDLISTTQDVLSTELQGVHSLRHLGSQLAEMEKVIEKMMEADFVRFAMEDIAQRASTKQGLSQGMEEADSEERLVSVVYGLLRQGKLHFLVALREALMPHLKARIRETLRSLLEVQDNEEDVEEAPSLAELMRAMEFGAWMSMLERLFDALLLQLSIVQASLRVISSVCEAATGKCTPDPHPGRAPDSLSSPVIAAQTSDPVKHDSLSAVPPAMNEHPQPISDNFHAALESFELSAATLEAEDRLAQLLLEDELSDALMGGASGGLPGHPSSAGPTPCRGAFDASYGGGGGGVVDAVLQAGLDRGLPAPTTVGGVAAPTELSTTSDSEGKERLEGGMVATNIADDKAVISSSEYWRLLSECHDIMSVVCDMAHSRCAKILGIRAKAGLLENLVSADFMSLMRCVEKFVKASTDITGHQCPHLRSSLLSQARTFLDHFHETRKGKLSLLLDGERWKQAEVPAEIQTLVHHLETGLIPQARPTTPEGSSNQIPSQFLVVHGQSFSVVGTLLLLITIVVEYCQCADNLPMLTNELMSKLIETLKLFNARTCQLVLGAGAVEAVGLKTITARHIALVSRCLQAMMLLIPDIRKHFELRLVSKQHVLLSQFDQVTEDLSRHCMELNGKVVLIMEELIYKQLAKWEAKPPVPSPCFKVLVKQINKLHENLVDILPQRQLQALFGGIEQTFIDRLRVQLIKLGITNNGSTQHGIVNSELTNFKSTLGSLENISAFGNSLFDVWAANR